MKFITRSRISSKTRTKNFVTNQIYRLIGAARKQEVSRNLDFHPENRLPSLNKFPDEESGKYPAAPKGTARNSVEKSVIAPQRSCFARSRLMGRRPLSACETKRARLRCDPIKGEGQEGRREPPLPPSPRVRCEKTAETSAFTSLPTTSEWFARLGRIRSGDGITKSVLIARESIKAPRLSGKP